MKAIQLATVSALCLVSALAVAARANADPSDSEMSTRQPPVVTVPIQDQGQPAPGPGQAPGVVPGQPAAPPETVAIQPLPPVNAFQHESIGIRPLVGIVNVPNVTGNDTRGVGGMMFDTNVISRFMQPKGGAYFGPSIGVLYSHLGLVGSDFFGAGNPAGSSGTDLLEIPLDLKVGYTFSDVARLAVHGGANVLYNSSTSNPGAALRTNSLSSTWATYGNAGADVELGLGKSIALVFRPDWTFANTGSVFTGMLGVDFPVA